ncbi:MAG: HNH endonuclease [Desulfomonilaceae bacterium]
MSVSYPTKLLLAFRSGDRCAFTGCELALTVDSEIGDEPAVTGEAAHIAGERPDASRYDPTMTDEERNHYNNLIYLCGDHHTRIDRQKKAFTVARLLKIKADHESKVREAMNVAFAQVGFPELARATAWIARIPSGQPSDDFSIVPPNEKIRKNELSSCSQVTIRMGLGVVGEVRAFVERESVVDADFPERLKAGFLEQYYRLRKGGHKGDVLFDLMCKFAQQGMKDQSERSAGLAVLIYLFECCEVFEK